MDKPQLDSVREYLELRRQNNEITGVNTDLRQSPDNRTAQLSNLLTSIRLHGSNPYKGQDFDSLKDFTDLSETKQHVIRDIFLARADEAQKRGRDEEMMRYQSWAKSIVYHTSFGIEETQDLAEHQAPENNRNFAKSSELTTIDTTPTRAAERNGQQHRARQRSAGRHHQSCTQCCLGYGHRPSTCFDSHSSAFLRYIL